MKINGLDYNKLRDIVLAYTDDQKAILNNITTVKLSEGWEMPLGGEPGRFHTLEGLLGQVNDFTDPVGTVWYWSFEGDKPNMTRRVVKRLDDGWKNNPRRNIIAEKLEAIRRGDL